MKKFFVYVSLDGDMYFSTARKLYDYACQFDSRAPSYRTYLKKLRDKERITQIFNNGADARIDFMDRYR